MKYAVVIENYKVNNPLIELSARINVSLDNSRCDEPICSNINEKKSLII